MRRSVPIPLRTRVTSAPTASHSKAIWFMNEMRVASMALAAYLVISADGNRALGDDQLGPVHVPADGARHIQHVLQVGRAVLIRWRAHGDENDIRPLDRGADVGGELEASIALVAHDQRLEPGLVDRQP